MMNQLIVLALITLFSSLEANTVPNFGIGDSVIVTTQDGNALRGVVESGGDNRLVLKTSFGSLLLIYHKLVQ